MKKGIFSFLVILTFSFIFIVPTSLADNFNTTKKTHINPEQLVSENLYLISEEIIVDGNIAGDLIAVAKKITINGEIAGDLIALATEININGRVEGNVRAAVNNFNLTGSIAKNVNILAQEIYFNPKSFVGWDFIANSKLISLKGIITGDLKIIAENIILEGEIKQNANIKLKGESTSLNILPSTIINGDLKYSNTEELLLTNKENIKGNVEFNQYLSNKKVIKIISIVLSILAAIISSLFFVYILKAINKKTITGLKTLSIKDLTPSLLFLIIIPIIFSLLFITIIGIPLSIFIIIFYLIIIYLAKIVSVVFITNIIFEKVKGQKNFLLFLLLGTTISWLIFALPYVGEITATAAVLFGLSGLIKYVKNQSSDI